jgi:biotin carboxylase
VFGFQETSALVAARANEALGLPGNPHAAVAYLTDKAALRDRVNQLAATPVRFERCDRAAALVPAAERVGFPCVVKPRTGSGGQDVHKLHNAAEAHALARQLAPEPALIVEEYLEGPEYCVAAHSAHGRHSVLAVVRKHTTGVPECGDIGYELPASLGRGSLSKIHELVETTLTAAGQRGGPSHTEVVITARGPALIESHGHPGAERISELLSLATGIDPYSLAVATILDLPEPKPATKAQHTAARLLPLTLQAMHDARQCRSDSWANAPPAANASAAAQAPVFKTDRISIVFASLDCSPEPRTRPSQRQCVRSVAPTIITPPKPCPPGRCSAGGWWPTCAAPSTATCNACPCATTRTSRPAS